MWPLALALGGIAVAVGAATPALPPAIVFAAIVVIAIGLAVAVYPAFGAYLLLATTPLIAGIDRGVVIPLLRPSEVVLLIVAGTLLLRVLLGGLRDPAIRLRFGRIDAALALLAVTGSVVPLVWMLVRDKDVMQDDILYATQLWKYYGVFLVFRATVRTERQVRVCLWTAMVSGLIVAGVAIVQSLQLFGIPQLLATYYAPFDDTSALDINRGTSTLASSAAVADVMVIVMAIAAAWLLVIRSHRLLAAAMFVVFVLGTLAAGQFAGYVGILVGVTALGFITRRLGRLALSFMPVLVVGAVALWPVLERRLGGFDSPSGLPESWEGRLHNLQTYFWPELERNYNWVLGVRPAARVPSTSPWGGDWIFIESGHTWLLWIGGVPFLLAFFFFLFRALRTTAHIARQRAGGVGVAAAASFTALAVLAVLTTTDPHLTLRGTGDLSFALLALALTAQGVRALPARGPYARRGALDPRRHTGGGRRRVPAHDSRPAASRG